MGAHRGVLESYFAISFLKRALAIAEQAAITVLCRAANYRAMQITTSYASAINQIT
jgi:hypothetical protein